MNFALKTLEFDIVLANITKFAYTKTTKNHLLELKPSSNYLFVVNDLKTTDQMTILIAKYGNLSFIEDFDIYELLNTLKTINYLNITDILTIKLFIKMIIDLINYKKHINDYKEFNLIVDELNKLISLEHIMLSINQAIDYDGFILDEASLTLKDIRKRLKGAYDSRSKLTNSLLTKYQSYLAEHQFVTRNNRLTLSIKDTYKNKIAGIIHDISQTSKTIFIEPQEMVEKTIEIDYLHALEKNEIIIILETLTKYIKTELTCLLNNLEVALNLDFIHAKAKYALSINANMPKINNEGIVHLVNAKHPLIDLKKVVPISFKLDNNNHTMFITGPNTGGKTVAIKTCGLLTLMVQSGILVPASTQSNFNVFNNIFADIGDLQSIEQSLSTFSSHMKQIVSMVDNVTNNSLILLDELGSGTDPDQGVSLAMAIINHFHQYDVRLLLTTHYAELKQFAYENNGVLLASVAFDKETLAPLYKLNVGISGGSHALEIASRLGLNQSVVNEANNIYINHESDLNKIIENLNLEKQALLNKQEEIGLKEAKLNETINNYQNLLTKLDKEKELIIKDLTNKTKSEHESILSEANKLLETLKNKESISVPEYASLKSQISIPVINKHQTSNEKLFEGDFVYIKPYEQYGYISKIKGNKYFVSFGNFEMEFSKNDLKRSEKKSEKPKRTTVRKSDSKTPQASITSFEVDLRGHRYEDVYYKLDEAIDQAILSRLTRLYIIHGYGTGAIKDAVTKYLRKSSHVSSFRPGTHEEGFHGVTVVELK